MQDKPPSRIDQLFAKWDHAEDVRLQREIQEHIDTKAEELAHAAFLRGLACGAAVLLAVALLVAYLR